MCEKFILQIYKFKNKLLTWELHCKWAQLFFFFVNTVVHCKYTQLFFEYTGSWRRLSPEQCLEGSRFCSLFIYWQAMAHLHSSPWTHKAGVVLCDREAYPALQRASVCGPLPSKNSSPLIYRQSSRIRLSPENKTRILKFNFWSLMYLQAFVTI